jgi:hypothetical protein
MSPIEILLIALALSMDAFAVSLVGASTGDLIGMRSALHLALQLGFFHFLVPILGWAAGAGRGTSSVHLLGSGGRARLHRRAPAAWGDLHGGGITPARS